MDSLIILYRKVL